MPYILKRKFKDFKVMSISMDRKDPEYCSRNCKSSYRYQGDSYCGAFGDYAEKRYKKCIDAQKPIDFLLKNKKIMTKEKTIHLRLISEKMYDFVRFVYKKGEIKVVIIGESGMEEEHNQSEFDFGELEKRYLEAL